MGRQKWLWPRQMKWASATTEGGGSNNRKGQRAMSSRSLLSRLLRETIVLRFRFLVSRLEAQAKSRKPCTRPSLVCWGSFNSLRTRFLTIVAFFALHCGSFHHPSHNDTLYENFLRVKHLEAINPIHFAFLSCLPLAHILLDNFHILLATFLIHFTNYDHQIVTQLAACSNFTLSLYESPNFISF